ncbi:hypothetical protein FH609_020080 [Streptomyces sp. 3MP-14]|uniref:Uncharacterized protein n=1 Tax=Streptomyces mimosae TaxID=2586635 RepID=A0A5N5ZU75_9ACTN|nr:MULTISPECIES: hypothetical protein [Streptomyces]KAB8158870.1 hypothetical protein FH607_028620 [Streptomyces mimosae]KAB8174890.1 hypothetical protein FH609_020080 [Streptomyces sp. 3MP-14]
MRPSIPDYRPEWNGAAELASAADMTAVRAAGRAVVDLVLTDDDVFYDSLSDGLQADIITPVEMLEIALKPPSDDVDVVAAARMVRAAVDRHHGTPGAAPGELTTLTDQLPPAPPELLR